MVRYLGPFQTVCDDWNYWWTYLSEHISEATAFGFAQRALLMQSNPAQSNNVSDQGATAPVDGGSFDSPQGGNEYLHGPRSTARPSTTRATPTARPASAAIRRSSTTTTRRAATSTPMPHTPGDQGPTFAGRAHVPAGETFTRAPQTGPVTPPRPGEQLMRKRRNAKAD